MRFEGSIPFRSTIKQDRPPRGWSVLFYNNFSVGYTQTYNFTAISLYRQKDILRLLFVKAKIYVFQTMCGSSLFVEIRWAALGQVGYITQKEVLTARNA